MPLGQKQALFWFLILQVLNIPEETNIKTLSLRKSFKFISYWLFKQQTIVLFGKQNGWIFFTRITDLRREKEQSVLFLRDLDVVLLFVLNCFNKN